MTKYLFFVLLLVGCYNHKKATVQHGRAVSTFPDIGADYCARVYPAKDSLIKGDSVVVTDTVEIEGKTIIDTVQITKGDTVQITKTIQLPGKVVNKTTTIRDTVVRVDNAKLDACQIERRKISDALQTEQARSDKYQKQARTRLWIIIGLMAAVIVWAYFKLKRKK